MSLGSFGSFGAFGALRTRHGLDRHFDPEAQLLLLGGVDDGDGPIHRYVRVSELLVQGLVVPTFDLGTYTFDLGTYTFDLGTYTFDL